MPAPASRRYGGHGGGDAGRFAAGASERAGGSPDEHPDRGAGGEGESERHELGPGGFAGCRESPERISAIFATSSAGSGAGGSGAGPEVFSLGLFGFTELTDFANDAVSRANDAVSSKT